jgi:hypothetical protein
MNGPITQRHNQLPFKQELKISIKTNRLNKETPVLNRK